MTGKLKPEPPSNRPPVALGDIPPQTLTEGDEFQGSVDALFSDPDGDALTYSATSSNSGVVTASISGAIITVEAVTEGTATVTVTATDPDGASASLSVSFTVLGRNESPVVTDTIPPQNLTEGDTVTLDVSGNFSDPDGDELTFTVESTNTNAATATIDGSVVTIIAVAEGMAIVAVTATDPDDAFALQEVMVTVEAANRAPVAVGTIPDAGLAVGEEVTAPVVQFFSDPDGDELTYAAVSGDTMVVTASMAGSLITVVGVGAGETTITVTATDPEGLSATQTANFTVTAVNQAPVVVMEIPHQDLGVGDTLTLDLSTNFADPDGDSLAFTVTSDDTTVATVSVDGSMVMVVGVGPGAAFVGVTATDPGGLSANQVFAATVVSGNRAPVAVGTIPDAGLAVGEEFTAPVVQFFSDPDGDELTYAAVSGDTMVVTASMAGSLITVVGVGAGETTITVTATDPEGLSATQTANFTVTAVNQAPVLTDTIPHQDLGVGDTLTLDVSTNFADPDGDSLAFTVTSDDTTVATVSVDGSMVTVVGVGPGAAFVGVTATDPGGLSVTQAFAATVVLGNQAPVAVGTIPDAGLAVGEEVTAPVVQFFSDPDGDELTYAAVSGDTMVVTASMAGSLITVVGVGAGETTITVTATDPEGLSATQTANFTVTAVNQAPVLVMEIPHQDLGVGGTVTLDVSGTFTDPDGDTLTLTVESEDTTVATASLDGTMLTLVGIDVGTSFVSLTATDPGGLSATQVFAAFVASGNQAPMAEGEIPAQSLKVGDSATVDVSGNFSDPDDDELIYTAGSSDDDIATASLSGAEVTVTGVAAGSATVTVTATDPGGLSATQTFDVTVAVGNQAPVAVGEIAAQTLTVGDSVPVDVSGNFSDPDDDDLIYMAASSDEAVATVSVSGAEVTVTGVAAGSATVTVTATDPGDLSATQTFDVTVVLGNQAPVAVGEIAAQTLTAGDSVPVDVSGNFSDPDDDELIYMAASSDEAVATVSVSGAEVTVTGVAAGSATVTVTATDPGDLSATQTFDVTVNAANQGPEAVDTIPVHDVFITLDTLDMTMTDTITKVVLDMSDYFSDPDGDELMYMASTVLDTMAAVESVEGSVVTTIAVAADTALLYDTTMLMVTATDPDGLSVTQEAMVRVAASDYEVWEGLRITETGQFVFAGLALSGCFGLDEFLVPPNVYTVHWSEWQVKKGSGWVQVPGTYKELEVCAYTDLPDAPDGTYRLVGFVTIYPAGQPENAVTYRRKTENEIEISN